MQESVNFPLQKLIFAMYCKREKIPLATLKNNRPCPYTITLEFLIVLYDYTLSCSAQIPGLAAYIQLA